MFYIVVTNDRIILYTVSLPMAMQKAKTLPNARIFEVTELRGLENQLENQQKETIK